MEKDENGEMGNGKYLPLSLCARSRSFITTTDPFFVRKNLGPLTGAKNVLAFAVFSLLVDRLGWTFQQIEGAPPPSNLGGML